MCSFFKKSIHDLENTINNQDDPLPELPYSFQVSDTKKKNIPSFKFT